MTMMYRSCRNTTTSCELWPHVFLLLLVSNVVLSFGRMVDSSELLCGEWDLCIKSDQVTFESGLFPPMRIPAEESSSSTEISGRSSHRFLQRAAQSYPCRLTLFSNGTFILCPTSVPHRSRAGDFLLMRGEWNVKGNPYCPTDRFYDEFTFQSNPRVQKEVSEGKERILNQGMFTFHCRLFGHYSPGRFGRRFGSNGQGWYAKGRLRRGSIRWETKAGKYTTKASFTGQRLVYSSTDSAAKSTDQGINETE